MDFEAVDFCQTKVLSAQSQPVHTSRDFSGEFDAVVATCQRSRRRAGAALARALSQRPITLRLRSKWLSYNPLQNSRFIGRKLFYFWTPTVEELITILKNLRRHCIVWGPIGSGKSYAASLAAIVNRMDPLTPTVLINNPQHIFEYPASIFYELVYAFADDSCPSDTTSEEYAMHPVGMIKKSFLYCTAGDKSVVKVLRKLMRKLRCYCDNKSLSFTLFFDQMNANQYNNCNVKMQEYLFREFRDHFHKSIGLVSATNDLAFNARNYPVIRLRAALGLETIKGFTENYLGLEVADEDVERIENCVGSNLLHLRILLTLEGGTVKEKIESFDVWAKREIHDIYKKNTKWLAEYESKTPSLTRYCKIVSFCDTELEVKVTGVFPEDVFTHIDNRYLAYDDNRILRSSSPVALKAVMWVLAERQHEHNMNLIRRLHDRFLSRQQVGHALEILVQSVFWNRAIKVGNWNLKIPNSIPVNSDTELVTLDGLRGTLDIINGDSTGSKLYHVLIPTTRNFPASDVMLFCPDLKEFILIQVTVSRTHADPESDLLTKTDPEKHWNFVKLRAILEDFIGPVENPSGNLTPTLPGSRPIKKAKKNSKELTKAELHFLNKVKFVWIVATEDHRTELVNGGKTAFTIEEFYNNADIK